MIPEELLKASREAHARMSPVAEREIARLKALGLPEVYQTGSSGAGLMLPGDVSDLDIGVPHDGEPERVRGMLEAAGMPFRRMAGNNAIHSYTTPEGTWVDLQVRPRKEVDFLRAGIERLKKLPEEERRGILLEKHKIHSSGDNEAYKKWKGDLYERYGVIPPGGDWSKLGAYSYVPAEALDDVLTNGLHSGKSLLTDPERLAAAAKGRGVSREEFKRSIEEKLKSWKSYAVSGPNVLAHRIPEGMVLSEKHPTRASKLAPVQIDVERLLAEMPETKLYGMELKPYQKGVTKPGERHGYVDAQKLKELYGMTPEQYWSTYSDPENQGYYAPDVPHLAVHTPTGHIPAKFLKKAAYHDTSKPHTWTGPDGTVYDVKKLWGLAKDNPVEHVDFDRYIGKKVRGLLAKELGDVHEQRVQDADLSYPLLVSPENDRVDGTHRITKALRQGLTKLPAQRLTPEQMAQAILEKTASRTSNWATMKAYAHPTHYIDNIPHYNLVHGDVERDNPEEFARINELVRSGKMSLVNLDQKNTRPPTNKAFVKVGPVTYVMEGGTKEGAEQRRSHAPKTGPDHLKIKTVDGTKVRDNIDTDFTMGGNPSRYSYIPKGEMWVEKNLAPKDRVSTVIHEAIEHRLMKNKGMSYEKAHDEANTQDARVRRIYDRLHKAKKEPLLYEKVRQR